MTFHCPSSVLHVLQNLVPIMLYVPYNACTRHVLSMVVGGMGWGNDRFRFRFLLSDESASLLHHCTHILKVLERMDVETMNVNIICF